MHVQSYFIWPSLEANFYAALLMKAGTSYFFVLLSIHTVLKYPLFAWKVDFDPTYGLNIWYL